MQKLKALFHTSLSPAEYNQIAPMVAQQNLKTLQWVSLLNALLMLALAAATFFPFFSLVTANRHAYIILSVLSAVVFCATTVFLPKHRPFVKPLFYFFLTTVFAFSIYIGVITNKEQRASTICVLLLAIPLLITDKPWRISVLLSLSTLLFCTASYQVKEQGIFIADFVNCFCIFAISIAVNLAQQNTKYRSLYDRFVIEQNQLHLIHLQKAKLEESRISIMLSQIQPHFLYNSLSAISYLCEKDPLAAQTAIHDFSDYLRSNLDSLKRTVPVPFEKELEHVRIYLSLEKMRFDDDLNIAYQIQTTGFVVPSLTVQPLVENAVRYGILKKKGGGTVTIGTREYEDRFEVSVSDDGAGFDPNAPQTDGRTHVGIANVRARLAAMVGGTLDVQSEKGVGTTATITLPKKERDT